jgi:hypothetical protein
MVSGGLHIKYMDSSVLVFLVCAMLVVAFGFATLRLEMAAAPARRQRAGDSTMSSRSVNWLGGISLAVALIICCLTP